MEIRSKDGTIVLQATTPTLPADDPVLRYSVEQTLQDAADRVRGDHPRPGSEGLIRPTCDPVSSPLAGSPAVLHRRRCGDGRPRAAIRGS
jgi:hypothetical protein